MTDVNTNLVIDDFEKDSRYGSLYYARRFSMCNCVLGGRQSVAAPLTYTAFRMSLDEFNMKAIPGTVCVKPYVRWWPKGTARAYKIPIKIKTFIFSPYNEVHLPQYMLDDYVYYTLTPGQITAAGIPRSFFKIGHWSPDIFAARLQLMQHKIKAMWGDVVRILLFYDINNAPVNVRGRHRESVRIAEKILPEWSIVRVADCMKRSGEKDQRKRGDNRRNWCHHGQETRRLLFEEIENIEGVA